MPIGGQSNRMKIMGSVLRKQRASCLIIGKMSVYIKQRERKRILQNQKVNPVRSTWIEASHFQSLPVLENS